MGTHKTHIYKTTRTQPNIRMFERKRTHESLGQLEKRKSEYERTQEKVVPAAVSGYTDAYKQGLASGACTPGQVHGILKEIFDDMSCYVRLTSKFKLQTLAAEALKLTNETELKLKLCALVIELRPSNCSRHSCETQVKVTMCETLQALYGGEREYDASFLSEYDLQTCATNALEFVFKTDRSKRGLILTLCDLVVTLSTAKTPMDRVTLANRCKQAIDDD